MLVDTHCHLDFERFDGERDAIVARALAAGVKRIIVPALDLENCRTVLQLADRYSAVFAAVGVHPNSSAVWRDRWLDDLRQLAEHARVVAIGEIGLDYYWDKSPPDVQRQAFAAQLRLAAELDLPVIVHNREADAHVLQLLAESPLREKERPGVLHSFSTTWETAEAALEMGYYLGFAGPVTYPNADKLREVVARTPMDRILVETDAPFLAPQAYRGQRNEPAFVTEVARQVADVRENNLKIIEAMTTENAACVFGRNVVSG
ncbi:MAG TPA: TatD family hydrolase [Candidatus Sulfomarinibacteraceae bacterium]|nr:TatD family hydrolase [Candidatus Sulfomarinibacteraceae bacterium]